MSITIDGGEDHYSWAPPDKPRGLPWWATAAILVAVLALAFTVFASIGCCCGPRITDSQRPAPCRVVDGAVWQGDTLIANPIKGCVWEIRDGKAFGHGAFTLGKVNLVEPLDGPTGAK